MDTEKNRAAIGILVTDAVITRPPGDVGNPATYPFPVLYQKVPTASLGRIIENKDPSLLPPIREAAWELIRKGAAAITSTCGFMILYQQELARALPVPVFVSSLLQLPFIRRIIGSEDRIGILTAHSVHLTMLHLRFAGLEDPGAVMVVGLEERPAFREAIFGGAGALDFSAIQQEVVEAARELIREESRVKAILLECANLPPYAAAVQATVQLPVFDFNTMIHQVYRAIRQAPYSAPFPPPPTSSK